MSPKEQQILLTLSTELFEVIRRMRMGAGYGANYEWQAALKRVNAIMLQLSKPEK